jgi:hypothetical protein
MNVNWEALGELARRAYRRTGEVYLFLSLFLYLLASVVAHGPVGPGNYVNFVDHAFRWEAISHGRQNPVNTSDAREH